MRELTQHEMDIVAAGATSGAPWTTKAAGYIVGLLSGDDDSGESNGARGAHGRYERRTGRHYPGGDRIT